MKQTTLIFIFSIFCSMGYGQVSRIFFSSGGGSNQQMSTSVGEAFIGNGDNFGTGSRKSNSNVGIGENQGPTDRVLVFPNPTSGELTVVIVGDNEKNFTVRTFDFTGRLLSSKPKNSRQANVSLNNLSAGIYLIEVLSGNGQSIFNQKIIKQ